MILHMGITIPDYMHLTWGLTWPKLQTLERIHNGCQQISHTQTKQKKKNPASYHFNYCCHNNHSNIIIINQSTNQSSPPLLSSKLPSPSTLWTPSCSGHMTCRASVCHSPWTLSRHAGSLHNPSRHSQQPATADPKPPTSHNNFVPGS
jgi:hypothetical protein